LPLPNRTVTSPENGPVITKKPFWSVSVTMPFTSTRIPVRAASASRSGEKKSSRRANIVDGAVISSAVL
jgi:hypothetical protein